MAHVDTPLPFPAPSSMEAREVLALVRSAWRSLTDEGRRRAARALTQAFAEQCAGEDGRAETNHTAQTMDEPPTDHEWGSPRHASLATQSAARQNTPQPPSSLRVLVVDDIAMNRKVIEALLSSLGVSITFAENGEEAVRFVQDQHHDLVLMDVQMPVMDGVAATRHIRSWEAQTGRAPTPIIAVTANVLDEQVEHYFAAGMNACLAKPVEAHRLRSLVSGIQPRRRKTPSSTGSDGAHNTRDSA